MPSLVLNDRETGIGLMQIGRDLHRFIEIERSSLQFVIAQRFIGDVQPVERVVFVQCLQSFGNSARFLISIVLHKEIVIVAEQLDLSFGVLNAKPVHRIRLFQHPESVVDQRQHVHRP